MTTEIPLPPLHRPQVPRIYADIYLPDILRLADWCEKTAKEYARAAVLADRHKRNCGALERIAALLYEEATGEPWTVVGVEHPGPADRDYFRKLARKVLALAAPAYGGEDD